MRIGVDARVLFGQRTGIGRFLHGVLDAMARDDGGNEFILYSPRPIVFPTPSPRWRIATRRRMKGTNGTLWLQLYGPWLAWRDRLDVLWGPAFHLPVLLPAAIPGVVTVHDLVHLRFPETMDRRNYLGLKTLLRPSLWRARRITADSQATADDLRKFLGIAADKISVVYPGIAGDFHPREPEEAGQHASAAFGLKGPYLLTVSTVEPRKNLTALFQAYGALPESVRRRWPLIIAGASGWRNDAIYAAADALIREGSVRFLGYVADQDLPWLYAGATVFLFPSIYEGFGIPIVEAMATGIPVIASEIPVTREVAADAVSYVAPTDTAAWARAIASTVEDGQLQGRLRDRGLRRAARFTNEASAARLLALLERVAAGEAEPVPA